MHLSFAIGWIEVELLRLSIKVYIYPTIASRQSYLDIENFEFTLRQVYSSPGTQYVLKLRALKKSSHLKKTK